MGIRREMTDELQKQMAGWLPFSDDATIDFTPEEYLKMEYKPEHLPAADLMGYFATYTVRCFTQEENDAADELKKDVTGDVEDKKEKEHLRRAREIIRPCIVGIKNFYFLGMKDEVPYRADPSGGLDKKLAVKIRNQDVWPIFYFICRISCINPGESLSLKLPPASGRESMDSIAADAPTTTKDN